MERLIPNNFDHRIIKSVFEEGGIKPKTEENYIKSLEFIESEFEKYLIGILRRLDINATVKTDKYSLPYKDEVIYQRLLSTSFPKANYFFLYAVREFIKEILVRNVLKVRFYILIDLKVIPPLKMNKLDRGQVDLVIKFRFFGT